MLGSHAHDVVTSREPWKGLLGLFLVAFVGQNIRGVDSSEPGCNRRERIPLKILRADLFTHIE